MLSKLRFSSLRHIYWLIWLGLLSFVFWLSAYLMKVKLFQKRIVPVPDLHIDSTAWSLGPPAKVYTILNIVIRLSHLCCHNVLYFLNKPSVIVLTRLHSILQYCRILNTSHHLRLYSNWLSTLPSSSSHEGGELGGASQVK